MLILFVWFLQMDVDHLLLLPRISFASPVQHGCPIPVCAPDHRVRPSTLPLVRLTFVHCFLVLVVHSSIGNARFLALYALTGVAGNALSLVTRTIWPKAPGVGASGSVFGLTAVGVILWWCMFVGFETDWGCVHAVCLVHGSCYAQFGTAPVLRRPC